MKKFSTIIFVCFSIFSFGQNNNKVKMNKEVKELVELGKDSIIQLALTRIDKKASLENFTHTSVQTNGKEVYVVFSNPIMYLPINTIFYDNVGVNLNKTSSFKGSVANPIGFTSEKSIPYYTQTDAFKKNIEFVVEAIDSMDIADIKNFNSRMRILEKEDYYDISIVSETQESWYKIKKITGEMYDKGHTHLVPEPYIENDKAPFEEIDFSNKD